MHERGLIMAGLASVGAAGGRTSSASAITRSARARRRCFEREMTALCRAYARHHGPVRWPATDDEMWARCDREPAFAALVRQIEDLRREWLS